jgi:hypothetical protein
MDAERLKHLGRESSYRLDGDHLVVSGDKGERRIDLASVKAVRLAGIAEMIACELELAGGAKDTIVTDDRTTRAAYGRVVHAVHARLADRPGVSFVRGSWLLVGVLAAIGVVAVLAAFVIREGWIDVPPALRGKATLIMMSGAAWIVVGPLLVWRSRPRRSS